MQPFMEEATCSVKETFAKITTDGNVRLLPETLKSAIEKLPKDKASGDDDIC